ncbi:MAG: discoidin domain-containing protein, partial [Clostridia bacterium]
MTNAYTTDQIPTMTSNTTPSGVASAYSTPIYAAWIAMNDTNTSETDCWHSDATLNTVGYTWLQYQFTSAKIIERYTITGRNYEGPPGASPYPTTWKLQGSNNGTDWVDLDTQTGQTFTQSEKKTYSFQNTTAYVYYRLWITESSNGVHASIGEWELLEAYTQCYSEATIKTQGSYALKAVAAAVDTFSSQYPTQDTDHVKA